MYVECKTGLNDDGPAWIGRVTFSKSGHTVYFNGMALRRNGGQGIAGNYRDVLTGEEYWVSGVKKDGEDRHWAGTGKVQIDANVVAEYLAIIGRDMLDATRLAVCHDIVETDVRKFHEIENRPQ